MWAAALSLSTVIALWRVCSSSGDGELLNRLESGRPPPAVVTKIESALLSSLGLKQRPRRPAVPVPEYLQQIYSQVAETTRDLNTLDLNLPGHLTGSANTIHSLVHSEDKVDSSRYPAHLQRLWFNMSALPAEEALTAAELRLWWEPTHPQPQPARAAGTHTVQVYDIVRRTGAGGKPVLRLLDVVPVSRRSRSERHQLTLDVRPAVLRWLAQPRANHGLLVRVHGTADRAGHQLRLRKRSVDGDDGGDAAAELWERQRPLLVAFTDDGRPRGRVRRRSGAERDRKRQNNECRKRRLYVDFKEVGWDSWIVAPPGYDAYFCHGECNRFPMPAHLNATNHAIVQTLVHKKSQKGLSGSSVPPPCCIPTEMSSMSMLYHNDHDRVVLKNYQDMVVVQCGCR